MYQGKALWLISCRVFGVDYPQLLVSESLGVGVCMEIYMETYMETYMEIIYNCLLGVACVCMSVVIPTGNIYIH
jgi:hypothetical protein